MRLCILIALYVAHQAIADDTIRVDVWRDTWVSSVKGEDDANLGGASKLKVKSYQEFTLLDIPTYKLRGRVITGATLHLHSESKDYPQRLTVSSLATEWVEGKSGRYAREFGSASFTWAEQDRKPWAYPGSDLTAVMNGMGHTTWAMADASKPDAKGWQHVAVAPRVVAARVAEISHGFVVFDDVGSEWTRKGKGIEYHQYPNRYVSSRQGKAATGPYFTITLGEEDGQPPLPVTDIRSDPSALPQGESIITWVTPNDRGSAGVIGFNAQVIAARGSRIDAPRHLIPMAGKSGERVAMHLRDVDLEGGQHSIRITPVDAAGNVGPPTTAKLVVSDHKPLALPDSPLKPFADVGELPNVGGVKVAIIDAMDKVHPQTGVMIPSHPDGYMQANHLWSAEQKLVRLQAARNEFVAFNIVLSGDAAGVTASVKFDLPVRAELLQYGYVQTKAGPLPDPLLPLGDGVKASDRQHTMLLADVYVPHNAKPGVHHGRLRIEQNGKLLDIEVELTVWPFALPDRLSFIPQMNCYGLPSPPVEVEYYRLAHAHRTCLNRLSYNWRGEPSDGCAPKWDGKQFDWQQWDKRFGPLLDGSAFADMPRRGVPVDAFYLPISENWPIDIHSAYRGGYWADEALPDDYRKQFVAASRQFAEHLSERKWENTFFEFYLNGKVYYKREDWNRCSSPWIFDEPAHTQDYWALRWYGTAFQEAVMPVRGNVKTAFRCDISRPQWQRDLLDGVMDVNVVGGSFAKYQRLVLDRKHTNGEVVYNYGSTNGVAQSNVQPAAWCIDAWCSGADGVVPWQTVGKAKSWETGDAFCLFYPGKPAGQDGPVPSVRLKGYRRGQQDVEYLTLLGQATGEPRWSVAHAVRKQLALAGRVRKTSSGDAGTVEYDQLDPVLLWHLRTAVAKRLAHDYTGRTWGQTAGLHTPPRDATELERATRRMLAVPRNAVP